METTRTRPRPPPAESGETSKVRHIEHTPHRMVDLISSYGVNGSKPGLHQTSRFLGRHGQHTYTCLYFVSPSTENKQLAIISVRNNKFIHLCDRCKIQNWCMKAFIKTGELPRTLLFQGKKIDTLLMIPRT